MAVQKLDEAAIFHAARRIEDIDARAGFLEDACGQDEALRARVEALLHVHEEEKSFLNTPFAGPAHALDESISERPGTVIGPYELVEQIGEGGFGVVFMAEQPADPRAGFRHRLELGGHRESPRRSLFEERRA
jgi:hypothetical protein